MCNEKDDGMPIGQVNTTKGAPLLKEYDPLNDIEYISKNFVESANELNKLVKSMRKIKNYEHVVTKEEYRCIVGYVLAGVQTRNRDYL